MRARRPADTDEARDAVCRGCSSCGNPRSTVNRVRRVLASRRRDAPGGRVRSRLARPPTPTMPLRQPRNDVTVPVARTDNPFLSRNRPIWRESVRRTQASTNTSSPSHRGAETADECGSILVGGMLLRCASTYRSDRQADSARRCSIQVSGKPAPSVALESRARSARGTHDRRWSAPCGDDGISSWSSPDSVMSAQRCAGSNAAAPVMRT